VPLFSPRALAARLARKTVMRPLRAWAEARDKRDILRTRNLLAIPPRGRRSGGKRAYAEWAHVIGLFQALMAAHLPARGPGGEGRQILDVGCGSGLLALAAQPLLADGDGYLGLDAQESEIAFCKRWYAGLAGLSFRHHDQANAHYSPEGRPRGQWAVADGSVDLVAALSVWTHLDEADARFLIGEVGRVLKPGGRAVVTAFLLDGDYDPGHIAEGANPPTHTTARASWIFDTPARGSGHWFQPGWAAVPERAAAFDETGLARLCEDGGLSLLERFRGNWKQKPGLYFQDILVFEKG